MLKKNIATESRGGGKEYQHINTECAISSLSKTGVALCLFYEDTIRMWRGLRALSNSDQVADF